MTVTALLEGMVVWYPFIAFVNYLMYRQYRVLSDPSTRRLALIVWCVGIALELIYPLLAIGSV
mgnify:CR=1 FL=1